MVWSKQWVLGALATGLAATYLFVPYRLGVVCGDSMDPSMRNGQVYLINQNKQENESAKAGDVVVFKRDGAQYIKRVLAAPGDSIYLMRQEGADDFLVMDWQYSFLKSAQTRKAFNTGKMVKRTVPPGHYFVVGDNLDHSTDSRSFGPIATESVIGKLVSPPKAVPRIHRVVFHQGAGQGA